MKEFQVIEVWNEPIDSLQDLVKLKIGRYGAVIDCLNDNSSAAALCSFSIDENIYNTWNKKCYYS